MCTRLAAPALSFLLMLTPFILIVLSVESHSHAPRRVTPAVTAAAAAPPTAAPAAAQVAGQPPALAAAAGGVTIDPPAHDGEMDLAAVVELLRTVAETLHKHTARFDALEQKMERQHQSPARQRLHMATDNMVGLCSLCQRLAPSALMSALVAYLRFLC